MSSDPKASVTIAPEDVASELEESLGIAPLGYARS